MRILYIAALAAIVAVPAAAQTAGPGPYNGFFIGAQGGWQQDRQRLTVTQGGLESRATQSKSGFEYGGQVGYDIRITPNFVAGIEGSVTGRTGSDDFADGAGNPVRLKAGRTLNASARLGYLTGPDSLVYVRGGYSNARFNLDTSGGRISEDRDGYIAGVGYEQMVSRNVSARLEYDYSHYGSDTLALSGFDTSKLRYERHQVTAGLNFRF